MNTTLARPNTARLSPHWTTWLQSFLSAFALAFLAACSGVPISYHDTTTYTRLTNLKAETGALIESFDKKPASENEAKIDAVALDLRKAVEYERGKGDPNSDTSAQLDKISKLFAEIIQEARDNKPGQLGPNYFSEAAKVLGQAFDIAIQTENAKNKGKG